MRGWIAGISESGLVPFFLTNAVFSFFFTLLWEVFFKDYPEYERRKVWKPLAIYLAFCVVLLLVQLLVTKK